MGSLKRVKIDEQLLWRAYRNSPNALSLLNSTIPDPLRPSLPPGWGLQLSYPLFISGTGKVTDFKFCRNIHRVDRNK